MEYYLSIAATLALLYVINQLRNYFLRRKTNPQEFYRPTRDNDGSLKRRLGAFEKLTFHMSASGRDGDGNVMTVLLLNSQVPLDQSLVKKALSLLSQRYPLLRMRISVDSSNVLWFKEMEDKSKFIFESVKDSARDWGEIFEKESNKSFDLSNGPLWRVIMLEGFYDKDKENYENCLVFTFHHIICDGGALMALYSQFLEYLNDLQAGKDVVVESMALLEPCIALMSHKIQASFLEKILFSVLPALLRVKKLFFKPAKNFFMKVFPPAILQNPSAERKTVIIPRVIKSEEMSKIIKIGKQYKCTVHGALTAATRLAMAQILQSGTHNTLPDPLLFKSSFNVSLRKECKPEVTMKEFGCFISLSIMDLPTPCKNITPETFWKFAQDCNKMVHSRIAAKDHHRFLKIFANTDVESMYSVLGNGDESNGGRNDSLFNISNLGRFSIGENEDGWQHKFGGTYFAVAEQNRGSPFINCVMSVNGDLYWGLIYYLNITTRKQAEQFIDLSLAILRDACGSTDLPQVTPKKE